MSYAVHDWLRLVVMGSVVSVPSSTVMLLTPTQEVPLKCQSVRAEDVRALVSPRATFFESVMGV